MSIQHEAPLNTEEKDDLMQSEERYHKMIEEVQDYAILLLNREGIIQNWNKGAEKIKGYKEDEIIGKHFRSFYLPQDREDKLPEKLINEAIEKGRATHEGWRLRKDGSHFWGSVVITALHDNDNEVIGFSKVTRDLSERKEAEDQIKSYAGELEFQNKELEEFAYAASHDLKEPLRKIHFYNTYVAENCSEGLNDKAKHYLQRSIAATRRMQRLIEDILAYTKNTAALSVFEPVDLNEIVEELSTQHRDEMPGSKVIINVHELPVINAISFQVRQVLDNIITNSVKYRHPDRDCIITITGSQDAEYYEIAIKDNGIGFEQQYADKIFEIFQRLQSKNDSSGSGIGLAICKKIMQNHKGFIRATGKPDEGATFFLYFPV